MSNTGANLDLTDDSKILEINSPRNSLNGPHIVVFKDLDQRWAIVALTWDQKPRLGIRWFHGNGGNPFSSGNATWFIVPSALSHNMLLSLPIPHIVYRKTDDFLSGKITGKDLSSWLSSCNKEKI